MPFIELFTRNLDTIEMQINELLNPLTQDPYRGKPATRVLLKSITENVILLADTEQLEQLLNSQVNIMDYLDLAGLDKLF